MREQRRIGSCESQRSETETAGSHFRDELRLFLRIWSKGSPYRGNSIPIRFRSHERMGRKVGSGHVRMALSGDEFDLFLEKFGINYCKQILWQCVEQSKWRSQQRIGDSFAVQCDTGEFEGNTDVPDLASNDARSARPEAKWRFSFSLCSRKSQVVFDKVGENVDHRGGRFRKAEWFL